MKIEVMGIYASDSAKLIQNLTGLPFVQAASCADDILDGIPCVFDVDELPDSSWDDLLDWEEHR